MASYFLFSAIYLYVGISVREITIDLDLTQFLSLVM